MNMAQNNSPDIRTCNHCGNFYGPNYVGHNHTWEIWYCNMDCAFTNPDVRAEWAAIQRGRPLIPVVKISYSVSEYSDPNDDDSICY